LAVGEQKAKMKTATLRSDIEAALAGRVTAPFTYRGGKIIETASSGIAEIDSLAGGLPRGSLTEICGPPCSGRTGILLAALASRTVNAEACALVDGRDSFDPHAAEAAGVRLKNLLWVRCRNVDQSLRATDLLLQGGGFGLIAMDLSDLPAETVRSVPLNTWFRFRRTVEDTSTILLLIAQESNAKTCASLVLGMGMDSARWSGASEAAGLQRHTPACLLDGFQVHLEILRSRMKPVTEISTHHRSLTRAFGDASSLRHDWDAVFEAKTMWGFSGSPPPSEPKTEPKPK
jgi:hypothetical protein